MSIQWKSSLSARAIAILLPSLLVTGCGAVQAGAGSISTASTVASSSGSASTTDGQQALLDHIVANVDPGDVVSATVGPPAPSTGVPTADGWLTLQLPDPTVDPGDLRNAEARWEAALVAGAVRDQSQANGLPPVGGYTLTSDVGGSIVELGASTITGTTSDAESSTPPPDDKTLSSRITSDATGNRLSVGSIEFLHPLGTAVAIDLTAEDPSAIAHELEYTDIVGSMRDYDGVFVVIRDTTGKPGAVDWVARRVGESFYWIGSDEANGGDVSPLSENTTG